MMVARIRVGCPPVLLLSLLLGASPAAEGALNVTWWSLTTLVQDFSGEGQQNFAHFGTVQNPFANSHSAALSGSTAQTAYDFEWSADSGAFEITGSHLAQNNPAGSQHSLSQGFIRFTTEAELRADVRSVYDWNMPVYGSIVAMSFALLDRRAPQIALLRTEASEDTFQSWPLSGRFDESDAGIIPAGCDCQLRYTMSLANSPVSGPPTTGAGSFVFTLQPVPEPATALLLATPALAYAAGRRTRSFPR